MISPPVPIRLIVDGNVVLGIEVTMRLVVVHLGLDGRAFAAGNKNLRMEGKGINHARVV
jgi:hypothetical protein